MFCLNSISLFQFKTYIQSSFSFQERIIGICGNNGVGKTNLLDAIYYLCFTKSYFAKSDIQNVHHGAQGFRIEGNFDDNNKTEKAVCILREAGRKEFLLNNRLYEKFSQHIGKFPCVIITPDDVQIITDGSEERRRFIDTLLCQLDAKYLQCLMDYNKTLQQRNSLLKAFAERKQHDYHLLDVYDEQLVKTGMYIFQERKKFSEILLPLVKKFYKQIAGADESVDIKYESQLFSSSFENLLEQFHEKDLMLQRSSTGIHKDDIDISMNGQSFKSLASQGQRKSLLFALKLSEFEILKNEKGFAPLLLLDDVFEKLDASRMHNLLNWACIQNSGQIFITDTHCKRIKKHFEELPIKYQLITL
ncbi:MAG TPA: DNA replication and repair protein RecF [Puia sp.]|nr:DNA replication and repair protein RecF [Puia sp.]